MDIHGSGEKILVFPNFRMFSPRRHHHQIFFCCWEGLEIGDGFYFIVLHKIDSFLCFISQE